MKKYRICLLGFVTISGVLSIGLGKSVYADVTTIDKPKSVAELESVEVVKTHRRLETNPVTAKENQVSVNVKENVVSQSNTSEYNELQQPLDLSVPYKDPENAVLKIKQNTPQNPENNIFAPETKNKNRPLQLNGNFLMSPEPEAEKRKTVDGAGIVINIKP